MARPDSSGPRASSMSEAFRGRGDKKASETSVAGLSAGGGREHTLPSTINL